MKIELTQNRVSKTWMAHLVTKDTNERAGYDFYLEERKSTAEEALKTILDLYNELEEDMKYSFERDGF